ncbi:hypothetical protein FDX20_00925, partial [Citrobacter sp. TBCS-11]
FQISKIFEKISGASFSEKFKSFYQHLTHPEEFPYEKPEHIKASLRSYQETGVCLSSGLRINSAKDDA